MHGVRERQIGHTMVKVTDVVPESAESVCLVAYHLSLVVEAFHSTVANRHVEVVQ